MKRRILSVILVCLMLTGVMQGFAFAAQVEGEIDVEDGYDFNSQIHTHAWQNGYSYNTTHHWKKCENGCTELNAFAEHTFSQNKCTLCNFEKGEEIVVNPYTDISENNWYYEAAMYAYKHGLMSGMTATEFGPKTTTSRAMIVTILYRLEGKPAISSASGFSDIAAGKWYSDAVAWAAQNGVVNGYEDKTFKPNDPITREQMALILQQYAAFKGKDTSAQADLSSFADVAKVGKWAKNALAWANNAGLITGLPGNLLDPKGYAVRSQSAAILMRFCENIIK